jgi:hypothetical protein
VMLDAASQNQKRLRASVGSTYSSTMLHDEFRRTSSMSPRFLHGVIVGLRAVAKLDDDERTIARLRGNSRSTQIVSAKILTAGYRSWKDVLIQIVRNWNAR